MLAGAAAWLALLGAALVWGTRTSPAVCLILGLALAIGVVAGIRSVRRRAGGLVTVVWTRDGRWIGWDRRGTRHSLTLSRRSVDFRFIVVLVFHERGRRYRLVLDRTSVSARQLRMLRARFRLHEHRPADTAC